MDACVSEAVLETGLDQLPQAGGVGQRSLWTGGEEGSLAFLMKQGLLSNGDLNHPRGGRGLTSVTGSSQRAEQL